MVGYFLVLAAAAAIAIAAPAVQLQQRAVTPLSASELSSFAPFTQFARAAYCPTSRLVGWNCGEACDATSDFQPTLVGGDGNAIQIFFVGYWPSQDTIVVGHEGTDPTKFLSVLTDVNILMDPLDTSLFPGVSSDVQVHDGFRNQHALTASPILSEVRRLMSAHNTQSVTCVGHSLGGALAELDAVFFRKNLPSSTNIRAFTYGTPRVGNPAWASLVNSNIPNFKRINNEKDIIPIVPGRFLGYGHPAGEVHITSPGNAVACSGDDNATDNQCTIKTVPNIFEGNILDHEQIYEILHVGYTLKK
ncbi:hypothetical protein AGABI1DRAFT_105879 [Agaricus bisporus var. burnettii JB137-S8]|uniref:Fungal lipase-type domain-containing protein n=1 Tax=Agaricus bisporus var. burnettii (strain JB137-S8 / ATCC MYA-4627 / FGSC 10392) TaxID=597362 RepID=K5W2L7_AGABU|nr:uncharacterized protein AGABI1DRAFT_105879 [Agaricus bisporus var. burnettii JB137-S8]EKM81044.1 hypothetical protein AGABI1DRAFT_105879 [Agaricus bisporus var. burnettii JB137-S8]